MPLGLLLEMAAEASPDRVAVGPASGGITYRGLFELASAAAARILASACRAVAFVDVNGPAYPVALFAAALAGVPFSPLNYRLAPDAVSALLDRLDQPLVLAGGQYRDQLASRRLVPTESLLETRAGSEQLPIVDDATVAVLLFTSGTTSEPKAVMLRHSHLFSYVVQTVEFGCAGEDEAILVAVPPYHVAAVGSALTNVYGGRRMVHLGDFAPDRWLESVRREGITNSMVVPTMLARIVSHLAGREAAVPTLRNLAYGGARMPVDVLRAALDAFPNVEFVNAYGLTETSSTIAVLGPDDHRAALTSDDPKLRRRLGSVGRPVEGVEIEVRSDGRVQRAGEAGEVWLRGDQVSGEYLAQDSVLDEGGWFPTRDRGWVDEDGYLYIEGRVDDTIIRGGENVAPAEVEDALRGHPSVAEVGVVGRPDDEWGHRILAVVVLKPGAAAVSAEELRAFARARVRGSRSPDDIVFAAELPYTPTGKLLRRELLALCEAATSK